MLDFVALAFLAIFTVLFDFNEARNSFLACANWVLTATARVLRSHEAHVKNMASVVYFRFVCECRFHTKCVREEKVQ